MDDVEIILEEDQDLESNDGGSDEFLSIHTTPQDLYRKDTQWNQFKRGWEPFIGLEMPVGMLSMYGVFASGFDPIVTLGIGAANLPGVYGLRNTNKAASKKNDLDSELENWYLFDTDYNLSELLEEANSLGDMESDKMFDAYQEALSDLTDVREEIEELTSTDIANENFSEDYNYGIQMVRIEEDTDFGGYNFEVGVYIGDKNLGVYRGKTDDKEIVEKLEDDGINATNGRNILSNYFDLDKPFGIRWSKPKSH